MLRDQTIIGAVHPAGRWVGQRTEVNPRGTTSLIGRIWLEPAQERPGPTPVPPVRVSGTLSLGPSRDF